MKEIGLIKAFLEVKKFSKLDVFSKKRISEERLQSLISYSREHSPYYKKLYEKLPQRCTLSMLPPVSKKELMENFDSWCTDSNIKLSDIKSFMADDENKNKKYLGKYTVFTTATTEGEGAIILYNKTAYNIATAISNLRLIASEDTYKSFKRKGGKVAGIFKNSEYYKGGKILSFNEKNFFLKRKQLLIDVSEPTEEKVKKLNEFKPALLSSYPSELDILAGEAKVGRLSISPVLIIAEGEKMSTKLKEKLKAIFGCEVYSAYSTTETGLIASQCRLGRFHTNEDWLIVEAVDENNRPIEPGEKSAKILVTNLSNFTQPLIRYEINDEVCVHKEMCSCGQSSHFLDVSGVKEQSFQFEGGYGKTVSISETDFQNVLDSVENVIRYQVICKDKNEIELRLCCNNEEDKKEAFTKAKALLEEYLLSRDVKRPKVALSKKEPQIEAICGRFRKVKKGKN